MTTDRPVKCPLCEEYFKRSECEFKYFKNRYWHLTCFNEKGKEEEEKQKLLQYIQRLFHKKIDYKINNQLKNYVNNKKYKYKDIYNALYYFFEIKGNSIAKANGGIGIVPYVIDEAKDYFERKKNIAARTEKLEPMRIKIVRIKDPTNKPKYKCNRFIDMNNI